jgi:crotonobetainyl-CoA:carnitine CoA-transferase CaiB-like acyl-CoA transferase
MPARSPWYEPEASARARGRRRLIARADVVLENFRPGVMARLGSTTPSVRELHREWSTALCRSTGSTAPAATGRLIDNIVQATSGMMSAER